MAATRPYASDAARVAWLWAHPREWLDYQDDGWHTWQKRRVVTLMKRDGLVSRTTYWNDVNLLRLCTLCNQEPTR